MKEALDPVIQDTVDKIKNHEMDGHTYEYETKNKYTNETHYHVVNIENGEIRDSIETHGKSFNNKENEKYIVSNEKIIRTDKAIASFVEKAPYRFKSVLDQDKYREYKQKKDIEKADVRRQSLDSPIPSEETPKLDSHIKDLKTSNLTNEKIQVFIRSLGKVVLIVTLTYFAYKLFIKLKNRFTKSRRQKHQHKRRSRID